MSEDIGTPGERAAIEAALDDGRDGEAERLLDAMLDRDDPPPGARAGREQVDYWASTKILTGGSIFLESFGPSEGIFEDKVVPETQYHADAPVGTHSGTFFKTGRVRDGMSVWRWGGRDPSPEAQP